MVLIVIPILVVVFLATRYGVKSGSRNIRVVSYLGIFLSVALMFLLAFALIAERIEN